MAKLNLPPDRLAVLRVVREFGSSVCVGACEHWKPGELHCHNISQAVKISSVGAKRRLGELVQLGLLVRERFPVLLLGAGAGLLGVFEVPKDSFHLVAKEDRL